MLINIFNFISLFVDLKEETSDAVCCVVIDMLSLLSEHAPLVCTVYPQLPANIVLVRMCYIQHQTFKSLKFV